MGNTVSKVPAEYFAFATMPNGIVDLGKLKPKRHLKMATYDLPLFLKKSDVDDLTPASLKGMAIDKAFEQIISGDKDEFLISTAEMAETVAASCYLIVAEQAITGYRITVPWDNARIRSEKALIRWRKDILDGKQVGGDITKCTVDEDGVHLIIRVTVPYDYTK